jgi:hypothetical protein
MLNCTHARENKLRSINLLFNAFGLVAHKFNDAIWITYFGVFSISYRWETNCVPLILECERMKKEKKNNAKTKKRKERWLSPKPL